MDQDRLAWAENEITRLRAELAEARACIERHDDLLCQLDTSEDSRAVAEDRIAALEAELAALREPAGDALVAVAAREVAKFRNWTIPSASIGIARAVLDAVLPRVRAEGWRTMESAPTDRRILVCKDGEQAVVFLGVSMEEGDGAWIIARSLGSDPVAFRFRDPSHWRPLPPPPDAAP